MLFGMLHVKKIASTKNDGVTLISRRRYLYFFASMNVS